MPAGSARSTRDDSPETAARRLREESGPPAAPKTALWEALANLSVGRDDTKEKSADVVHPHETVWLTEAQSAGFLDPRRHRVPPIRPAKDQNKPAPPITARDLFGRPPGPPVDARPDPPRDPERTVLGYPLGASKVEGESADREYATNAPEANDPQVDLSVDPDAAKDR
jgi:hypothetical protein